MLPQVKILFRGISQVFLIENALTGLFFIAAIAIGSWQLALCTLAGTLISTLAAYFLKASTNDITIGLYGFNGALVGLATCFLYGYTFYSFSALIIGSIFSSVLMKLMKSKFRPLTSPYIFTVWIIALNNCLVKATTRVTPGAITPIPKDINIFYAIPRGVGQVLFEGSIYSSVLIIVGLFIANKVGAIYALYGALLAIAVAYFLSASVVDINIGLLGFNAVLCAIALGSDTKISFLIVTITCIVSTLLYFVLAKTPIFVSTSPFVLTTWITLIIQKKYKDKLITKV